MEAWPLAIVAGIDEAGYGPLLGPLVVTGVVFETPDEALDACLWDLLSESVTRRISRRDHRLPVLDSKKLYKSGADLAALERTALAWLHTVGSAVRTIPSEGRAPDRGPHSGPYDEPRPPITLGDLLACVAPHVRDELAQYPWYCGLDYALPAAAHPDAISIAGAALRRNTRSRGLRLAGVLAEPLLEGRYNRLIDSTGNKAVVLLHLTLRIVDRIIRGAGGERVRILIDRQGGRCRYREPLMTAFPDFELHILEESESRSAYRLSRGAAVCTLEFCTGGEDHHLPIALASIYSKYLRELFMRGLNRYWEQRVPGLRPTAGYYTDACRFLTDIAPAVQRDGCDRSLLVRSR